MRKANFVAALCALALLAIPMALPISAAGKNGAQAKDQPPKELTDADVPRISVDELLLIMAKKQPVVVVDVRALDTYSEKIRGALQIPLDEVEARMKEIPRNREIVTYCA